MNSILRFPVVDYGKHEIYPLDPVFPLSELSARCAEQFGPHPAFRVSRGGKYVEWTFERLNQTVEAVARWILDQGVKKGEHLAIIGNNSPEWEATYLAIQRAGAVCIPIDRMLPASGIRHILCDSGSTMLFGDTSFLKMLADVESVSSLKKTISLDNDRYNGCLLFDEVEHIGEDLDVKFPERDVDDLAAILYTSGTTGHSKGVMLTGRNISSDMVMAGQFYNPGPGDNWLSVLPVHHSFEATAGFLFALYKGCCITFAKTLAGPEIVATIRETKVTYMAGVPLLFEKMQAGIFRNLKKKSKFAQAMFKGLLNTVKFGEKFGLDLGPALFRSIRKKAGMGTIKVFLSAGAPLDPEIGAFFNRMGFKLLQGYGLTETSPCTHLTPPWKIKHECVGPPMPGVEVRIDRANEEGIGEICVKGPNVFKGYYKNEDATKATFTEDGWFRTGDLGLIHDDGYLQVTGRLKAMLVTAGGKNVYPEEIEFYLNRSAFISESVVLGIPRKQGLGDEIAAMIHPDYEQIDIHSESTGKSYTPQDIYELIKAEIQRAQENLAEYKKIKTFKIFESEFQKTTKRTIKRFLYSADSMMVGENTEQPST